MERDSDTENLPLAALRHTMVFKNSDNPYLGLSEFFVRIFQVQTAVVFLINVSDP